MDDQLFGRVGEVGDDSIASDFNVRVDDGRGSLLTENVDQTVLKRRARDVTACARWEEKCCLWSSHLRAGLNIPDADASVPTSTDLKTVSL